jgi:hypothetical protein
MPDIASPAEPATKCRRLIPAIVFSLGATFLFVGGYPIRPAACFTGVLKMKCQACRIFLIARKYHAT